MSDSYAEAMRKANEIREELIRREDNPPEAWEIEQFLSQSGWELLRTFLQGWLDNLAAKELAAKEKVQVDVVGPDGIRRPYARERSRTLMTPFGEVTANRMGYSAPGATSVFPLDKQLNWPQRTYSPAMQDRVALGVANDSYDKTVEQIELYTGGHVPKRQAEVVAREYAQDFDGFYRQRQATEHYQAKEDFLILTLDGKGVVMLHEDLREQTRRRAEEGVHKLETRLSAGEKHNRKRMATVAAVYSVDAYPRAPEEIMDKEAREQLPPAPKPVDKRVWASLEHSPAEVLDEMVAEGKRRDPTGKLKWVFLVDGADEQLRQVHKAIKRHKIQALVLMDFVHILDYLWDAAWCLYKQGDPAAEEWVKQHAIDVLLGKSSDVAAGMRRSATNRGLSEAERKPLDICANHLIKNREHLRYDEALNKGMPIATGVIEGACRHLVRRRMECSGATWSLKGAEAVLRLRAVSMSGDWKEYSAYHREKEQSRNYPENAAQRLAA
jgi:hypothetical protein